MFGRCNTVTFSRLYNKVKHLSTVFFTGDWGVFLRVLLGDVMLLVKCIRLLLSGVTVVCVIILGGL